MATAIARPSAVVSTAAPPGRLVYLDNLKLVLVAGVIIGHAATNYIGGGGWAVTQGELSPLMMLVGAVGAVFTFYWLGVFFLIAGLLTPQALRRHGTAHFLHERVLRLGIPLVAYVVVIMPVLRYLLYVATHAHPTRPAGEYMLGVLRSLDPGPTWFLAVLMALSLLYVAWNALRSRPPAPVTPLRVSTLVLLAVLIAVPSFPIRLQWSVFSREILDLHVWQWPQYAVMYWFGTVCADRGWLRSLPTTLWHRLGLTLLGGIAVLGALVLIGGGLSGNFVPFTGGLTWQAAATAAAESVIAVSGSLWTLELFRRRLDHQGPFAQRLTRCAFGAYLVQGPVLAAIALLIDPLRLPIEIDFVLLASAGVIASYALAWLLVNKLRVAPQIF